MSVTGTKMRIGEVHTLLRADYPDIELSKIRYYEDKGLVQPERSRKGYRLYSDRDVACLREAIRLAQEEFVPLRVVRLRLIEQGLLDEAPVTSTREAARSVSNPRVVAIPPAPKPRLTVMARPVETVVVETTESYSSSDFLAATGIDADDVNQMISLGLLLPVAENGSTQFSSLDVRVALAATPLIARGADLRLLGALRRVVEREMGIVDDLTASLRSPVSGLSLDEVQAVTAEVAGEVAVLRSVLHERAVRAIFD
ncbi:MAG TPA: MerR family transcriptional regulator [Acidimicrobiales bacterium]|nr:MerR family transcriptional regulator [Acidimicrobiales bacterium]